MAAVQIPPVLPDDAALLQMIQALEDQARTYQTNRVLCKCPQGNWQGVNQDLMQGLRDLEDRVTTIEGNDQLCNCLLNGQQAGANADQHPGLQDLEGRVAVLEAANPAPCACPLNGHQVDGDGDIALADAMVQTDDTGQTDAAVQAGITVDPVLPVQPLDPSQVAAVDGSGKPVQSDTPNPPGQSVNAVRSRISYRKLIQPTLVIQYNLVIKTPMMSWPGRSRLSITSLS